MADKFARFYSDLDSPAAGANTVTPSDSTVLDTFSRAIYVGEAGDLAVVTVENWEAANNDANNVTGVTFVAVPAGSVLPLRAALVLSTGTTANSIVAMY